MGNYLANPSTYTFNPAARTITFTSSIPARQGQIISISRAKGGLLYQPEDPAYAGTWISPTLTLAQNTTTYLSTDDLKVWLNDGTPAQTVSGPLTNNELRSQAVPTSPDITRGGGPTTASVARMTLATDDPAAQALLGINTKLPASPATAGNQETANTSLAAIDADLGADGVSPPALPGGATGVRGWLRLLVSLVPALVSGRWPVDGSAVTQPISALALPLPGGAATETRQTTGNTSLASIDGKLTGVASDATLAQVRDAIKAQLDLESTLWTDNSGSYFVRRDTVNQGTGVVTITFTDPTGATAPPGAGLRPLSAVDRDITQVLFDVTTTGTGYATGDLLARVIIIDANPSTPVVTPIWINLTTGAIISAPTPDHIERSDETIGARQVGSWTVTGPLTDNQLRAQAVPTSPNVTRGGGAVDANVTRVTLATDGPGVAALSNIDADLGAPTDSPAANPTATAGIGALIRLGLQNAATALANWDTLIARIPVLVSNRVPVNAAFTALTPTVTSIPSSVTSVTLLATNSNRRALWVTNDSTSVLRLSFSTPATQANSSVLFQPGQFLILDPLMIGTGAIYGIWATANGTAQVTEWT